jgi:CcmD family protein
MAKLLLLVLVLVVAGFAPLDPAFVRRAGSTEGGPAGVILYAQQSPPQQQDEFVPIDELPPQDQLSAAPLLVAAYSFVVLALFAYVASVARRLTTVQRELERLETDLKRGSSA